jgi:hypothetical protein
MAVSRKGHCRAPRWYASFSATPCAGGLNGYHAGGLPCAILVNHTTTAGGCERLRLNTYNYVGNNPLVLSDPLGLYSGLVSDRINELLSGSTGNKNQSAAGQCAMPHDKLCPPCTPPVGTIGYRLDTTHPHGGMMPHVHLFERQQDPRNCHCFWKKIGVTSPPPPPGAVPL